MSGIRVLALLLLALLAVSPPGAYGGLLEVCERLEQRRQMIHQRFKDSKRCEPSTIGRGWTDCTVRAAGTVIRVVGVQGISPAGRAVGLLGSGFHIDAVGPQHTVRVVEEEFVGRVIRVDARDFRAPTGCVGDEARITLDARILSPGELLALQTANRRPQTPAERTRELQESLITLGYLQGPPDGVMGATTRAALAAYRRDRAIPATASEDLLLARVALDALGKSLEGFVPRAPQGAR